MNQDTPDLAATNVQPQPVILGPVTGQERFASMDVIRGVALFGILLMNIFGFGYGIGSTEYIDPATRAGADYWTWFVMAFALEGTQRTLFSLLFGAGVIILTSRIEERGAGLFTADIFYRRNIWLIAFGMINSYLLLWNGDILYHYGIVALFLFPLRNMSPRNLIVTGMVGFLALSMVYGYDKNTTFKEFTEYTEAQEVLAGGGELNEDQQEAVEKWEEAVKDHVPDQEEILEVIDEHTGSYWTTFMRHVPYLTKSHGNETYLYMFLDGFSMMVLGMALFKLGFLTLQRPSSHYWILAVVGYGVGLSVSWWEVNHIISNDFDMLAMAETWPTYDMGRLGNGLGHLGLLLLFVRSGWLGWLQSSLAAVGRMALTNYIMHSVIAMFLFLGVGFGMYARFSRIELYYVVLAIVVFQLILSPIWLKYYRFGPLEWVWRSLTYLRRPQLKR